MAANHPEQITAEDVLLAAENGDPMAVDIVGEVAR